MNLHLSGKSPLLPILVGLALREGLSFWTGHPFDFEVWLRNAYYVSQGANPYTFFPPVPGISFEYFDRSIGSVGYPPFWPLLLAGIFRGYSVLPIENRFVLYLLLKQPGVVGDALLGVAMYRGILAWGGSHAAALRALRFWSLCPYAIAISAIWGQFDALVALFWLAFLLASSQAKRGLSFGVSILLKVLPVIYAPYLLLRERGKSRVTILAALAIPAGVTAAVFSLTGWSLTPFLGTLETNVQGSVVVGMTYMNLFVDPGVHSALASYGLFYIVLRHVWIPGILLASVFAYRRFSGREPADTVQASLFLLVVFLLTRWGVNEQLLISLFPLLLLDAVLWHPERRWLWISLMVVAFAFLLVDTDLFFLLVGPASPGVVPTSEAIQQAWGLVAIRRHLMQGLGLLFTVLLIQVAWVLADPKRSATPWPLRALRMVRSFPALNGRGA